jgi:hypothetical protein
MAAQISTVQDLHDWIDDHAALYLTGNERQQIADAILSGECPRFGTDWSEFLDGLPTFSEILDGDY